MFAITPFAPLIILFFSIGFLKTRKWIWTFSIFHQAYCPISAKTSILDSTYCSANEEGPVEQFLCDFCKWMVGEIEMLLEQGKTEEDVIKALLGVSKKILAFY